METKCFTLSHSNALPTLKGPLVSKYRSTLTLIFRLMVSKKAFIVVHYSALILSDETRYHTFWALCLERSSPRALVSSYLQATLYFPSFCYPGCSIILLQNNIEYRMIFFSNNFITIRLDYKSSKKTKTCIMNFY